MEDSQNVKPRKYYKFLGPNLTGSNNFYYPAPTWNGKQWIPGPWISHPDPDRFSKEACGTGLHLLKVLSPLYTRYTGNCYEAEGQDLLGEDDNKARFVTVRLIRPVHPDEIFTPGANLEGAYLKGANLAGADLRGANLKGANLKGAYMEGTDLSVAYLGGAFLGGAFLRGANLKQANLEGTDLKGANLKAANLEGANLEAANLEGAYLGGTDLRGANLEGTDLRGADLEGAQMPGKYKDSKILKLVRNIDSVAWV